MAEEFKISGGAVKSLLEQTIDEMELEASYLVERTELEIEKLMLTEGISKKAATLRVLDIISNEDEWMASWMNKNRKIIDEIHSQLVAKPVNIYASKKPSQKFAWILDGGAKHCSDCSYMSGLEPRTLNEWYDEGVGLPREGGTKCNVGCKCSLTPV